MGKGKALWLAAGAVTALVLLTCGGVAIAIKSALDRKLYSTSVAGPRIAIAADDPMLPVWVPDAADDGQLSSTISFDRYAIRLPPAYTLVETTPKPLPVPPGGRSQDWTWASPRTPRGTRHVVTCLLFDVGPTVDAKRFFEAHLPEYLEHIGKRTTQTPRTEQGVVAGRFAVRVEHSQTDANGRVASCVDLFWFDGPTMVNLGAIVPETDGADSFNRLKAALLTLHGQ